MTRNGKFRKYSEIDGGISFQELVLVHVSEEAKKERLLLCVVFLSATSMAEPFDSKPEKLRNGTLMEDREENMEVKQRNRLSSLPRNYVSLKQLQQQRLKEKEQKKEEEELQRKLEEDQRLKEEQKKKKMEDEEQKKLVQVQVSEKARADDEEVKPSSNQKRWGRNQRLKEKKEKQKMEDGKNDSEVEKEKPQRIETKKVQVSPKSWSKIERNESEVEEIVVVDAEPEVLDSDQKIEQVELKNRKFRKRHTKKKPKAVETLIEEQKEFPHSENVTEEKPQIANVANKGNRRKGKNALPNQTVAVEEVMEKLSVCDDDEEQKKSTTMEKKKNQKNGGYSRNFNGGGRKFGSRRKPVDGELVWVRKDEVSGGFTTG